MVDLLSVFNNIRNDAVDECIISFLKGIKWFSENFAGEEHQSMRKFIKNFEVLKLDRYSKIVRRGDDSDHFFVLLSGRASVLKEIESEGLPNQIPPKKILRREVIFIDQIPN